MFKLFFGSVILGFFLAGAAFIHLVGPREIQEHVCRNYAPEIKPLAVSRAEKAQTNYLAKHQQKSYARRGIAWPKPAPVVATPPAAPVAAASPSPPSTAQIVTPVTPAIVKPAAPSAAAGKVARAKAVALKKKRAAAAARVRALRKSRRKGTLVSKGFSQSSLAMPPQQQQAAVLDFTGDDDVGDPSRTCVGRVCSNLGVR